MVCRLLLFLPWPNLRGFKLPDLLIIGIINNILINNILKGILQ